MKKLHSISMATYTNLYIKNNLPRKETALNDTKSTRSISTLLTSSILFNRFS
jgi:hypothetical protein